MSPSLVFIDLLPHDERGRDTLARAIDQLRAESDTLDAQWNRERGCLVVGSPGFLALERLVDRLKREFMVEARVGRPVIAYRETVHHAAEGHGRFIRQTGGRGQFGEVVLRLHPAAPGSGAAVDSTQLRGALPERFVPFVDRAVNDALTSGIDGGFPIVDVRVELIGGAWHETDSSEAAFHTATVIALSQAATRAQRIVLEPVMTVAVSVPDRHAQATLALITSRQGLVQSVAPLGDEARIVARVPLAGLMAWDGELREATFGRGTWTSTFAGYQPMTRPPGGEDDDTLPVGAPRRPVPPRRHTSSQVPEPDDFW